MKHYTMLDEK